MLIQDSAARQKDIEVFLKQNQRQKMKNALDSASEATSKVLEDSKRQPGQYLSSNVIQDRLKRLNPSLMFEQSRAYPDQCGIYVRSEGANSDDLDVSCRNRKFVTGMVFGISPENTIPRMVDNSHGDKIPQGVVKGWRDVLKVLIQMRLITLAGAEKAFGKGTSEIWYRLLG